MLLRRLFGMTAERYRLEALVRARSVELLDHDTPRHHIICDLDKTYVETEFESWVKMARIPFERPHEKITVAGANEVLVAVRNDELTQCQTPMTGLHFVSSSPPQLRAALEGKLVLDQLDWTSDTFKNQSYNIRMARIDLLRHHIAYKTKAILDIASTTAADSVLWMVGDNAEYDGFIYWGIKLLIEGRLSSEGFAGWLAAAKVERSVIYQVLNGVEWLKERRLKVAGILIRKLNNYQVVHQKPFTDEICMFDSWFQVAWQWLAAGLINANDLWGLVRSFHNLHGVPLEHIAWCLDRASANEGLNPQLKSAVDKALERLYQSDVKPLRSLAWELNGSVVHREIEFSPDQMIGLARSWYESIELARSYRKR